MLNLVPIRKGIKAILGTCVESILDTHSALRTKRWSLEKNLSCLYSPFYVKFSVFLIPSSPLKLVSLSENALKFDFYESHLMPFH